MVDDAQNGLQRALRVDLAGEVYTPDVITGVGFG